VLEGKPGGGAPVGEHEPVRALGVVGSGRWRLVARPVVIAREDPVELGEGPGVGGVEDHALQAGVGLVAHGTAGQAGRMR
jgi:hypothetical protein